MASFREKLTEIEQGKETTVRSLTFLSDLSMEDRATFREMWPQFPVERRRRIVDALVTMAEDNIELYFRPVFLVSLDDADAQVRLSAIEGLYEDESRYLLDKLLVILENDPDDAVRQAAAKALGRFTYLMQCDKLKSDSDSTRLRSALLRSAQDEDEEDDVRRRSVEALGYLAGDPEIEALILETYNRGGRNTESAIFAMGRNMDERWQRTVLDELESANAAYRFEAARAAGEMVLEDALPFLVRMVDDNDSEVRLATVWALGQIGGKPAAEALVRAMKSGEPALQEAAQEAMNEIAFSNNPLNVL